MPTFLDRVKMTTATTGATSPLVLGSAVSAYQTINSADGKDQETYRYLIEDGTNWEVGYGVYAASGTTLTRNVLESSNADALISLSGSAIVSITFDENDAVILNGGAASAAFGGI